MNDRGYFSNKLVEPRARVKLVAAKIQVSTLTPVVWLSSAPLVIISVCAGGDKNHSSICQLLNMIGFQLICELVKMQTVKHRALALTAIDLKQK